MDELTPVELRALIGRLGLETGSAAHLCHVQPRTFRRWLAGTREPDGPAVRRLLVADAVPVARAWLVANRAGGPTACGTPC
jgi:hypothetical protein